jgi:hypothetical protein
MKIKIVKGNGLCTPCESLIETVQKLIEAEPELKLSYEVFVKGTDEANVILKEHSDRGFVYSGGPLWILYGNKDEYVKTFLGFPLPDYGPKRLTDLKDSILLKNNSMAHPVSPLIFPK